MANQAALARLKPNDPSVAERFELYWAGIELANGFSELTDAREQRLRFEAAHEQRRADEPCEAYRGIYRMHRKLAGHGGRSVGGQDRVSAGSTVATPRCSA